MTPRYPKTIWDNELDEVPKTGPEYAKRLRSLTPDIVEAFERTERTTISKRWPKMSIDDDLLELNYHSPLLDEWKKKINWKERSWRLDISGAVLRGEEYTIEQKQFFAFLKLLREYGISDEHVIKKLKTILDEEKEITKMIADNSESINFVIGKE